VGVVGILPARDFRRAGAHANLCHDPSDRVGGARRGP
jgi:hypothetical protein